MAVVRAVGLIAALACLQIEADLWQGQPAHQQDVSDVLLHTGFEMMTRHKPVEYAARIFDAETVFVKLPITL